MGSALDSFARQQGPELDAELQFQDVFESAPLPMAYFHVNGNVVHLNESFHETFGYLEEDLPSLEAWYAAAYPDPAYRQEVVESSRASFEAAFATGNRRLTPVERRITCKDGRVVTGIMSGARFDHAVVVCFFDLSDLRKTESSLRASEERYRQIAGSLEMKNWALTAYANAADALRTAKSEASLAQAVCESITRERQYLLCWIGIAEEGPRRPVRIVGASGPGVSYLADLNVSWSEEEPNGKGPTGRCIRTRRMQRLEDTETDVSFAPWRERARSQGIRSSISVPLLQSDKALGALMVYAPTPGAFGDEECALFERLASEVAHGWTSFQRNRELAEQTARHELAQQQLSLALEATITAMSSTMEQRDPYTAGHERRVAEIALAIGAELGWDPDRLHGMRMAGLVHDIGKISVPAEILSKPTRLTAPEFELVKQHAETGYQILKDVPFPWPVARMVHEHHERLDGRGYPQGLRGDQMLPESRVLAIADMLEAMASHRPYRPSRGLEFALKQVESEAGTTLDADGVAACLRLYRDQKRPLPV